VRRAKYLFNKGQRPVLEGGEIVTCFRDGEATLRKNRRLSGFTEATDYSQCLRLTFLLAHFGDLR